MEEKEAAAAGIAPVAVVKEVVGMAAKVEVGMIPAAVKVVSVTWEEANNPVAVAEEETGCPVMGSVPAAARCNLGRWQQWRARWLARGEGRQGPTPWPCRRSSDGSFARGARALLNSIALERA